MITNGSSIYAIELCKKLLKEDVDTNIIMVDTKKIYDNYLNDNKRVIFSEQDICDNIFLTLDNLEKIYQILLCDDSERSLDISYIGTKNLIKLSKKYNSEVSNNI